MATAFKSVRKISSVCARICALSPGCSHMCSYVCSHRCNAHMCACPHTSALRYACSQMCALYVRSHTCALVCVLSQVCSCMCALIGMPTYVYSHVCVRACEFIRALMTPIHAPCACSVLSRVCSHMSCVLSCVCSHGCALDLFSLVFFYSSTQHCLGSLADCMNGTDVSSSLFAPGRPPPRAQRWKTS